VQKTDALDGGQHVSCYGVELRGMAGRQGSGYGTWPCAAAVGISHSTLLTGDQQQQQQQLLQQLNGRKPHQQLQSCTMLHVLKPPPHLTALLAQVKAGRKFSHL